MRRQLLFLYNPYSGKAQIKNHLTDIIDIMVKAEYEVTVYPTQAPGDAVQKVAESAGRYDLIVCSGGDGTLDEAVTGMMKCERKVPIGYIPAGSTNDFASSLGIPRDMPAAARVAVHGEPFLCDIGGFNEDYFVYVAAFGLFTEVSYQTSRESKNLLGHAAYILEGIKSLYDISSVRLRAEYGDTVIEDEFIYGMITNSTSVGGFKGMTGKDVALNDGLFEVTLVKMPHNPLELNDAIVSLANPTAHGNMLYSFKTNRICFFSENEVTWTLDGEFGGSHTQVVVENLYEAMEIIVPE